MYKIQTTKDATWTDADGNKVPFKFIPASDRKKESIAGKIVKGALKIERDLANFYEEVEAGYNEVYRQMLEDYELRYNKERKIKGSYSWYNFDKSIKIEASMNDLVKWDEAMMSEARQELDTYLGLNLTDANELIRGLVQSAFHNSKGMIDTGKVFQLLKYEGKIKQKNFANACRLMRGAQSVASSKKYTRIWVREADGSYRNVNLNFSSL